MSKKTVFNADSHRTTLHTSVFAVCADIATMTDSLGALRQTIRALLTDALASNQQRADVLVDLIRSWGSEPIAPLAYSTLQSAVSDETKKMRAEGVDLWVSMERRKNGEVVKAAVDNQPISKAQATAEEKRQARQTEKEAAKAAAAAAVTGDGIRASLAAFKPAPIGQPSERTATPEEYAQAVIDQLPASMSLDGLVMRLVERLDASGKAKVAPLVNAPSANARRSGQAA